MSAADLKKLIVAYPRTGDLLSSCGDLYDSDEEYVLALAAKLYVENEQAREPFQHRDLRAMLTMAAQLHASNRALNERIEKLREALGFYAPETQYVVAGYERGLNLASPDVMCDEGNKARDALAADDDAQRKG